MRTQNKIICAIYVAVFSLSLSLFLLLKLSKTPVIEAPLERITMRVQGMDADEIESAFLSSKLYNAVLLEGKPAKPNPSKQAHDFRGPVYVDTSRDKKKCPNLYEIAWEMLDGTRIKLPSETKKTRWNFRERGDLNVLATTKLLWTPPWKSSNVADMIKKLQRYNVTARTVKARKILLTYGHNCCEASKEFAVNEAIDTAKVDYAEALDLSALSLPFQISHSNVLRRRKGAGYWLWKPYIILKTMLTKMNDGDMLIYQDAGSHFVSDAGPLFKLCMAAKHNILSFHLSYQESQYSKRDAFVLMGMDEPRVYQKGQTQRMANLIVLMKTCKTIQFMMEYLAYTSDARITTDDKNVMGLPNLPNFKANRHDQTVFSLLSKKWGIEELRNPIKCHHSGCDKGYNYAFGPYFQLYVHDRNRS